MDEEEREEMRDTQRAKRARRPPDDTENKEELRNKDKNITERHGKNKNKSVLFVPYTNGSVLAKRLREAEENLLKSTGYKLKIEERGGTKLEDLLYKSDPCQVQDCERQDCLLFSTKQRTGKNLKQECSKRNAVYQTYCITCKEREIERIEQETAGDRKRTQEELHKIRLHKYIGETSRSCFERGMEHLNDMRQLKPASHLLRHALD